MEAAGIDSEIPGSSSRDPSSRAREFLIPIGEALGLLRLARYGDRWRGSERGGEVRQNFQPTNQPPGPEDIPGFPDPWPETDRHPSW